MKRSSFPMDEFSIYAWPAYSTKKRNPYTYLIYKNIEAQGHPVSDFYLSKLKFVLKAAFATKAKIFHLHWPHSNILKSESRLLAWRRIALFSFAIRLFKLTGKKLIWTVHELEDHENRLPDLRQRIDRILYRNMNGFISMNQKLAESLQKKVDPKRNQKIAHIAHPHYKGYYANNLSQQEARKKMDIGSDNFVFLFLGQIRNYKNVPGLIEAFKALNNEKAVLVIAGWLKSDTLLASLKELAKDAQNIKLYTDFIEDDEIQVFINAADLVVTPYKRIYNSGSVFLNLSFGKPTLGPDMYALSELRDVLGSQWVKTYADGLTAEALNQGMEEVTLEINERQQPNLDCYNPEVIARQTIDFYQTLLTA